MKIPITFEKLRIGKPGTSSHSMFIHVSFIMKLL